MRDVAAGEKVMGSPAKPIRQYFREVARCGKAHQKVLRAPTTPADKGQSAVDPTPKEALNIGEICRILTFATG